MTTTTADLVLSALQSYDLKQEPSGQYRFNSPFRAGSNSHAVRLTIDADGEHGTWNDFVSGDHGSLYQLADQLGIRRDARPKEAPTTKRGYAGLDEYAAAHHAPADAFLAAGWKATKAQCPEKHIARPALEIPTATGPRYRFTDGQTPPFKSPAGYKPSWYKLAEAIALADGVIVLCNGEPSVITAQHYGVAATCITGSGEKRLPPELLTELRAAWTGAIVVALDCDDTGRKATPGLVAQLQAAGYDARAVDMRGADGFDLADWCGLHGATSSADLLVRPSDQPSDQPVITPRFTVASEAALMDLPPVRYLDRELGLVAQTYHLIYGASGSGKTFFAIERAMRQVSLGRRVLYIATEDVRGLRYRIVAWRRANPGASGKLTWLQMPEGLDLQDPNQVAELLEAVEPYEYDHIILDTLREAHAGDENSSQDTHRINSAIQRLMSTGAALDVVHHTGVNGERPRGSTALFGNTDAVIKVEEDDGYIRITFDKWRVASPRDSILFGLVQQDTGLTDTDGEPVISAVLRPASQTTRRDAKISPIQRKVLATLALSIFDGIGAKAQQVIDTAEISRRNVYLALASLKTRGFVSQGDKGDPYMITPAGRAQLGAELVQPPSDQSFVASQSGSDRSDQQVINSDQHPTDSEVITSDHTRRVITGSHISTDSAYRSAKPIHKPNVNERLAREQMEAEAAALAAQSATDDDEAPDF